MKKALILWLILAPVGLSFGLEASKAKVFIRENKDRAQLSLIVQIANRHRIPKGTSYEAKLVREMKNALFKVLPRQKDLKIHPHFTHVYVTALNKSSDEEILALISKSPDEEVPSINIYSQEEDQVQESPLASKKSAPRNLFAQIREKKNAR